MNIKIIKMGGTVVLKELTEPIFLSTLKDNSIIVVSAIGRYPYSFSTDGLIRSADEKISLKEKDRLMAIGETYSAIQVSSLLLSKNKKAISLGIEDAPIVTNSNYGKAEFIRFDYSHIKKMFFKYDFIIVPGFIGRDEYYHPTTIGRENSDLSAILYAKYLGIDSVNFIKDIDGVKEITNGQLNENLFVSKITYDLALVRAKDKMIPISYDAIKLASNLNIKINIKDRKDILMCVIE